MSALGVAVALLLVTAGGAVEAAVNGDGKLWRYVVTPSGTGIPQPSTPAPAQSVSLALDPATGTPAIAYTDATTGLAYGRQSAMGWLQLGAGAASTGPAQATNMAIHPTNSQPYISYLNLASGETCSIVRWNFTHWVPIGLPNSPVVSEIVLDYSSSTLGLVVAYNTYPDEKASVQRYLNKAWMPVGSPAFTPAAARGLSLAVAQGVPYLAFQDASTTQGLGRVMKYNSSTLKWAYMGKPFSTGKVAELSLAIHPTTFAPWVLYLALPIGSLTVVRYSASQNTWQVAGRPGFALDSISNSLAFDSAGTPHIAYQCNAPAVAKACVRRLSNSTWTAQGTQGLSVGKATFISLRFNKLTPYLAYSDTGFKGRAVVRMWA